MKMFFGRLPVVQDGNCNSPWICEPSWEHWELFPEPLLQPFTTLFFTWHSPASPSLPLSWQPHSTSMPCLSLCRSAWLELAYSTLWLPFGKGRGARRASKLTQGVGFHRQHVLGHKAWTPDRGALIRQFEGGRFKRSETRFAAGNNPKENIRKFPIWTV